TPPFVALVENVPDDTAASRRCERQLRARSALQLRARLEALAVAPRQPLQRLRHRPQAPAVGVAQRPTAVRRPAAAHHHSPATRPGRGPPAPPPPPRSAPAPPR